MEKEIFELMKKVLSDKSYFSLKISVDEINFSTRFEKDLGMSDKDKDIMGYCMEEEPREGKSQIIVPENAIEKSETVGDFVLLVSSKNN